ncbi:MAG: hypothetical protein ABSG80_16260 [Verrucomicrobiota bacterium]|jgi:hypothetical protein
MNKTFMDSSTDEHGFLTTKYTNHTKGRARSPLRAVTFFSQNRLAVAKSWHGQP